MHNSKIYILSSLVTIFTLPSISYAWWGDNSTWSIWQNDDGRYQANIRVSPHGREYDHAAQPAYFPFAYRYTPYENPCYGNGYDNVNRYRNDEFSNRYREESESYSTPPAEFKRFDQNNYWATPYDMPFPPTSFSDQPDDLPENKIQAVDYKESVWNYPASSAKKGTVEKTVEPYTRSVWEYPHAASRPQHAVETQRVPSSWDYPSKQVVEKQNTIHMPADDAPPVHYQYPKPQNDLPTTSYTPPTAIPTMEGYSWQYPDETIAPVEPQSFDLPENNSFNTQNTPPPSYNAPDKSQMPRWQYVDDRGLPPLKQHTENMPVDNQQSREVVPQYPSESIPRTADYLLPPLK